MTDNAKEFMAFASKDEALRKELDSLVEGVNSTDGAFDGLVKFAASHGFTLTAEDFKREAGMKELDLDELEAVAGGSLSCSCSWLGYGKGSDGYIYCQCQMLGYGSHDGEQWAG